jgi:hypothetical protein
VAGIGSGGRRPTILGSGWNGQWLAMLGSGR